MAPDGLTGLSRRERQIMETLYRLGEASVAEVVDQIEDRPSYDSIRLTLGVLVEKGRVSHQRDGRRYVYRPTRSHAKASSSAVKNLVQTYFKGSPGDAILAMLDDSAARLTDQELEQIVERLRRAKEES